MDSFFAFFSSVIHQQPGIKPDGSNKPPKKDRSFELVMVGMISFAILAIVLTKAC